MVLNRMAKGWYNRLLLLWCCYYPLRFRNILFLLFLGAKEIDIAATLEHLRDQRMGMVKTKAQFEFALKAVAFEVQAILRQLQGTNSQSTTAAGGDLISLKESTSIAIH